MSEKNMLIDFGKFQTITKEMLTAATLCLLDKSIVDHLRKTTKTDIGKKLSIYLKEVCDSSEKHKDHICGPLPNAFEKVRTSLLRVEELSVKDLILK